MRVLLVGDVVGKAGRRVVGALLPTMRKELSVDFVVANGENLAHGRGTTEATVKELVSAGVDVISGGNHTWAYPEFVPLLDSNLPVLRPANYPPGVPGKGVWQSERLAIINLIGRTFMDALDDPFRTVDTLLSELPDGLPVLVDFHAEATSEKQALGWHLDGRVAAVVGTHTHVPTADARLLPQGTAYVTDLGMCGARDSVIGADADAVLTRFRTGLPTRLPPAEKGPAVLGAVLIKLDEDIGRARSIERVDRTWDPSVTETTGS